jgi:hypothetical protein
MPLQIVESSRHPLPEQVNETVANGRARFPAATVSFWPGACQMEAAMYVVIRKFSEMRSVREAAQRAETGIGQILKKSPGFRGYYVFDAGHGVAGSVTLFDTQRAAAEANEKALAWIRESLIDFIQGEPEVISGEVLVAVHP